MKKAIFTVLLICACTEHVHPEIEILTIPNDHCDGDQLIVHTSPWDSISEHCNFGCAEDLETAWCKSPCEATVCGPPPVEKACDGFTYLLEYKMKCVETFEAPHYECVPYVATRRYCGCYEEPSPHCYGE